MAGQYIILAAQLIGQLSWYIYIGFMLIIGLLVLVRYLVEPLRLNPFSRLVYNLMRPSSVLLGHMRKSQIYYPLRRFLRFDPAVLMLLIAAVVVCYAVSIVISYLLTIMSGVGRSLIAFGDGFASDGLRYLVGSLLLTAIFYLLVLMLILLVNWVFGVFAAAAHRALERIMPLLRIFKFRGVFAQWSFMILAIALSIATALVQAIFLS